MTVNNPIALRARCGSRDTTPIEFPGSRGIPIRHPCSSVREQGSI